MKQPSEYYLDVAVWKTGCWIVWPVNKESAKTWFKEKLDGEHDFENLDNHSDACAVLGSVPIIFLTQWKNNPEWISILAHECIHVATFMLKNCGVEEKESCDEALAYLVGYLVESFLKALTKKV